MRACQPTDEGYVERDGVKIYFETFGVGEPTIVFLRTWEIVHSRTWKCQVFTSLAAGGGDVRPAR